MNLLVLDFETFFDSKNGYTLKKMTTEEYIRDLRFLAHMIGYWCPDTMEAPAECSPTLLDEHDGFRELVSESACLFHHAHFDAFILAHHFGLKPKFILDTLPMARLLLPRLKSHSLGALAKHFGLPEKNVPYNLFDGVRELPPEIRVQVADGCKHDVALTCEIWKRMAPSVPREELQVIDCTVRMFSEPVLELDRPRMATFLKAEQIRKAKAMLAAGEALGLPAIALTSDSLKLRLQTIETELQSSAKFKVALEALGYACPMKVSPTTGEEIPAIAKSDEEMKALLEHDDPQVSALAAARLGVKSTIDETRAQRLLDSGSRGALPVYLAYAAAKTLRFGGGDKTNWQNFRRGGEIRKSIRAPEGHKLVIGDLSQIEYRLLCWLTGQNDKLEALAAGRDLYVEFATELYEEVVLKEDKPRRGVGKVGVLQSGYGASEISIQHAAANAQIPVQLTLTQALKAKNIYRTGHSRVVAFWDWCGKSALPALANGSTIDYQSDTVLQIHDQRIWLPNGTAIVYEGLRWARASEIFPGQDDQGEGPSWWEPSRKGWTRTWGSHVTADIVQALACVVIKHILVQMLARHCRTILQVHDELVFCVPDADAERVKAALTVEMRAPPAWCAGIPLDCEVLVSQEYSK